MQRPCTASELLPLLHGEGDSEREPLQEGTNPSSAGVRCRPGRRFGRVPVTERRAADRERPGTGVPSREHSAVNAIKQRECGERRFSPHGIETPFPSEAKFTFKILELSAFQHLEIIAFEHVFLSVLIFLSIFPFKR